MGTHIRIVFGPTLYFIPINPIIIIEISYDNPNWYALRESEMGHDISIEFGPTHFHVEKSICLVRRDWSSFSTY